MPGSDNGRWGWSTRPLTDGPVRRVDVMFPAEDRETLELMCAHEDQTASGLIRLALAQYEDRLNRRAPDWRDKAGRIRARAAKNT
jgi:hypothetical protein